MSLDSFLILIFCVGSFQYTTSSIPNITPCKRDDKVCYTNMANNIYQAVIRGDPELGIESLDPLAQELVVGNLPIINYTLTNSTCVGFQQCKILNAVYSRKMSKLLMELECPQFSMYGYYEINGDLIVMPIQGKGPYWIDCKNYLIKFDAEIKFTLNNDGKTYINIKNFNIEANLRGGMDFDLTNLFNGQKELADRVLQFARDNWKLVSKLLQGPTINANVKKLVIGFNKFMKHVPVESIINQ